MSHKVVYFYKFGEYGDIGGLEDYPEITKRYNKLAGTKFKDYEMTYVDRHDKFLVQAVEEYIASGNKTDLAVKTLKGNLYRIEDAGGEGLEDVIEPGDIPWCEIEEEV